MGLIPFVHNSLSQTLYLRRSRSRSGVNVESRRFKICSMEGSHSGGPSIRRSTSRTCSSTKSALLFSSSTATLASSINAINFSAGILEITNCACSWALSFRSRAISSFRLLIRRWADSRPLILGLNFIPCSLTQRLLNHLEGDPLRPLLPAVRTPDTQQDRVRHRHRGIGLGAELHMRPPRRHPTASALGFGRHARR